MVTQLNKPIKPVKCATNEFVELQCKYRICRICKPCERMFQPSQGVAAERLRTTGSYLYFCCPISAACPSPSRGGGGILIARDLSIYQLLLPPRNLLNVWDEWSCFVRSYLHPGKSPTLIMSTLHFRLNPEALLSFSPSWSSQKARGLF